MKPEQHVSDRERLLKQMKREEAYAISSGCSALCWIANSTNPLDGEACEVKAVRDATAAAHHGLTTLALRDALDNHQIALSYEAQVEQQAQQIGALRAEQARLRAQAIHVTSVIAMALAQLRHAYMLLVNGHLGPVMSFATGLIAPLIRRLEAVLAEGNSSELPPNPLQSEVEQLRAENERLKADNTALDQVCDAVQELIDSSGKRVCSEDLQAALDSLPEAPST